MAAAPVVPTPVTFGEYAYGICQEFKDTAKKVKDERDELFSKKPLIQKIAYYAVTVFAIASLLAAPACLAWAAVSVSLTWVGIALIPGVAMFAFSYLRGRFNSMTNEEEQVIGRFNNPMGLDNNQDSVPEASLLKGDRAYFESLVAEPKNGEAKKEQELKFAVVQKLFDKKFEAKIENEKVVPLKERIATLAVTSLLLESIQHVYKKEEKHAKETAERIENGKLIDLSSFANKDRIKVLTAQLKDASKEFQEAVKGAIAGENGKAKFKMSDLEKVTELAEKCKAAQAAQPKVDLAAKK